MAAAALLSGTGNMANQDLQSFERRAPETARILEQFNRVQQEIARAAKAAGRDPVDVTLVVASKTQGANEIEPLLQSGHRVFGENRVQEASAKWPPLKAAYSNVELRLIGPLQSNKAKEAVAFFDVIETIDRPKLASAIADEIAKQGRSPRLYIEVNTGDEPQKAGVNPHAADAFIRRCREEFGLTISGLMCVPPVGEQASPHFALLGAIAKRNQISDLSMGMTADFPLAIQLGATHVRVGSAIFGDRAR
ncbi:MAG: YggS family pyridoxal phosphate-dependent enzyme [Beijerinckiaceae bacterium]|nr:YggS family pyridoxal phosphate-dependent enzyme [Beijerinckiaceae bacterium]